MTRSKILEKFQIEYDKEAITSSYPSLTIKEIATILDKAYLAIIAQKLTGNNPRRAPFESDVKAVEDIRPLLTTSKVSKTDKIDNYVMNESCYSLPAAMLYFIQANASINNQVHTVALISHDNAQQFFHTEANEPWIKNAVCFIEGTTIAVLYDNYKHPNGLDGLRVTYIKYPGKFVDAISNNTFTGDFELNDSMAEELINLAIVMALENVESQRLTTKVQTRALEA